MFTCVYFPLSNWLIHFDTTGNVSSAFYVLTGSEVAIKMKVSSDTPTYCLAKLWCTTRCADTQGYSRANGLVLIEHPIS